MYRSYYSLTKKPFQLTTDPRFLWLGEKHKEALATLKYGVIDQKGFLLVTGDVGTGKTTLINALLESIEKDTLVANITDPAFSLIEFFNFVALSFNIPQKFDSKVDFIIYFRQFLKKVYSESRSVLLIIDEAHRLSKEVLEHIRLLSNIELPEEKLVKIFFVGQNEIYQTLVLPECRALRERISLIYKIEPLSENETLEYIKHRLKIAGTEKSIFTLSAVREIYQFSKGRPRLINIICDHALLTGYVRDLKKITPDVIMECALQFDSIGETWNESHSISYKQHQSECRSHSEICPFLKDSAGKAALSENTEDRVFNSPQAEISREQINVQKETRNNTADDSTMSAARRLRKRKFSWTPVLSFMTRMQKKLFPLIASAAKFIKHMQKILFSWILAAVTFLKRTQKSLSSRISAESFPALLQYKRLLGTFIIGSLVVIFILNSRWYKKESTTKSNSPKPTSLLFKTTPLPSNYSEGHLTPDKVQIKVAEINRDRPQKAISPKKTETPKPNFLERAKAALYKKKFSQAIELFERVVEQNPDSEQTIKIYYSKALIGQAASIFIKNPDTAQILLAKAIKADPKNAEAYFYLGRLYTKSKNYQEAIKAYQQSANLNHRPSDSFYNLGFIYASINDFANAEKMFLNVVDLKPPYIDKALFNLAVVQQKEGKQQECIKNLEKAILNNPKNQRARQYLNQLKKNN